MARVAAQDFVILRYEPVVELSITEPSSGDAAAGLDVSFTALGQQFAMTLARNELLTRNLSLEMQQRLGSTEFYVGALHGNADSWVRLTRTGAALSGAVWDGTELYAIELFERIAPHVVANAGLAPSDLVIYRSADTLSALTDVVAPAATPVESAAPSTGASEKPIFTDGLDEPVVHNKVIPAQQLNIALIADSEFVALNGAQSEANMLSIANVVDGIFFNQVGVRINVASLRTYAEPDAFSGTDAQALLNQLGDFKFGTAALRDQGLLHLLTGRDLDEPEGVPEGARLLGIANIGAVCDARDGTSLTQYTTLTTAAIMAAHEIGHNFGAPHDAQAGSPCESTSGTFLMNPFFSGSQQFSQCSLQQMDAVLAAAACLTNLPDNDLSVQRLSSPAEVMATRVFTVTFAVDYAGVGDALEPRLTVTTGGLRRYSLSAGAPASCGFWNANPMTCSFTRLAAAGGRVEFSVSSIADEAGPAYLDVEVSSLNDYVPSNNRYRFDFNVVPDARFLLSRSDAPAAVKPSESFDIDYVVVNAAQVPATNVRAEFRITDALEVIDIQTPSGAACVHDFESFDWLCPIGVVAPGAAVPMRLRLRADDYPDMPPGSRSEGAIWLKMVAAEPSYDIENVWLEAVTIAPRIADVYVDVTAPASAPVGAKIAITMRVGNRGRDAVTNLSAALRPSTGRISFDSAVSSRGSCAKEFWGNVLCDIPSLAIGETVEVIAQATVTSEGNLDESLFGVAGAGQSFDPDITNNEQQFVFRTATAPPPPAEPAAPAPSPAPTPAPTATPAPAATSGGGGGGGSVDLALLLLLVAGAALRARHCNRAAIPLKVSPSAAFRFAAIASSLRP